MRSSRWRSEPSTAIDLVWLATILSASVRLGFCAMMFIILFVSTFSPGEIALSSRAVRMTKSRNEISGRRLFFRSTNNAFAAFLP
ncbi:hypothetical protein D3C84_1143770 [compost metagenome]